VVSVDAGRDESTTETPAQVGGEREGAESCIKKDEITHKTPHPHRAKPQEPARGRGGRRWAPGKMCDHRRGKSVTHSTNTPRPTERGPPFSREEIEGGIPRSALLKSREGRLQRGSSKAASARKKRF